jgi:hypothetical protein
LEREIAVPTTASFEDDLSFLRGLVQSNGNHQALFGELYMAAGLTYGLQTLGHWAQALGVLSLSPYQGLALATGPTALFLAYLGWALWRSRRSPIGGVTNRAVNAAFGAAGFANLIMAAVVGMLAIREGSLTIWLLYPCLVFIIQGAAWGVAYALRRRAWLGLVALGWSAAAVVMAFFIGSPTYALIASLSMFVLMFAPGAAMLLLSRKGR